MSSFKKDGICSSIEAERLLAFTNNSGPLFIIGTVGISLFGDTRTGFLLLLTHILACISVGFLFRWWKSDKQGKSKIKKNIQKIQVSSELNMNNLGEVLGTSIMNSISTILMIGGFIVLFSVIISILNQSNVLSFFSQLFTPVFNFLHINPNLLDGLLTGILELTNGVSNIARVPNKAISTNVIFCSFLLGFGGTSVMLQVLSISSKVNISIKPYVIGKLLQGIFAAFYTYLFLKYSSFFNLDLVPTFAGISTRLDKNLNFASFLFVGIAIVIALYLDYIRRSRKSIN